MKYFLIVCLFTAIHCMYPRVKTKNGKLIGTTHVLSNGRTVNAFLGVPYAAPPIGRARFEAPRPPRRWFGYRNATIASKFCVQFFMTSEVVALQGEEDCLYLDIYTPKLPEKNQNKNKLMNVMFYIFGGAFAAGKSKNFIPDYILQGEDIMFVCINYRLGIFGFYSTGDEIIPGNNGLKDQVEALRWVKKNIHFFGGDPGKVTIYGSSAGGTAVQYLLLSPMSKGLFQKAISSSGTVLNSWALPPNVIQHSIAVANSVNCPTFNTSLMMKCMKRKSVQILYEASSHPFYKDLPHLASQIPFGPVIEPDNADAFLTDHPHTLLERGHVKHIPWMVSTVEKEASFTTMNFLSNNTKLETLNNKWYEMAPKLLQYDHIRSVRQRNRISSSIREYYFGNKVISNRTAKNLFQVFGDRHFDNGIIEASKLHASASSENTYCFKLYYRGTTSVCDRLYGPNKMNYGVCHGDELLYQFASSNGKFDNNKSKVDLDMAQLLTSIFIAFMKNGNPSTSDVEWQPMFKNNTMNCLNIYSYTYQKMEDIENHSTSEFWKKVHRSEEH